METKGKVYTPQEVGQMLRRSEPWTYRAIHRGEIPSFRIGQRIFIPKDQFDAFLVGKKNEKAV